MTFLRKIVLLAAGCLSACEAHDMADQARINIYAPSTLFSDGRSARPPVTGTVARGSLDDQDLYEQGMSTKIKKRAPFSLTREGLLRGQERFTIHCSPCHGQTGLGNGMVVQRGFPQPLSFHSDYLRSKDLRHFFQAITNGWGPMSSYREQVTVRDRWLIAYYIKALQLSRQVPLHSIPELEQKKLLELRP